MTKNRAHAPLRVFIGTSPGGEDAEACLALEYSIRSHASIPIVVSWLRLSHDPEDPCYSHLASKAGWQTEQWATPWTALRWAVPELCGWQGRAVYFDCPTIVLGDVVGCASAALPSGAFVLLRRVGGTLGTSCAVFDCAEAQKHFPTINKLQSDIGAHQGVGALLERHPFLVGQLPGNWGMTDAEFSLRSPELSSVGSVHFSSPLTQPHAPRALARLAQIGRQHWHDGVRLPHYSRCLVELFEMMYVQGVASGLSVEQYVSSASNKFQKWQR